MILLILLRKLNRLIFNQEWLSKHWSDQSGDQTLVFIPYTCACSSVIFFTRYAARIRQKILILGKKSSFHTIYQCWQNMKWSYLVKKTSHTFQHFKKNLQIRLQQKWQNQFRLENIHFGNAGDQPKFYRWKIRSKSISKITVFCRLLSFWVLTEGFVLDNFCVN